MKVPAYLLPTPAQERALLKIYEKTDERLDIIAISAIYINDLKIGFRTLEILYEKGFIHYYPNYIENKKTMACISHLGVLYVEHVIQKGGG